MIKRFEQIKEHFEKEAAVFDRLFLKVVPGYEEMMRALSEALPFPARARPDIVDLGCGTGNLTLRILETYPRARLTCVDMAENMLTMAKAKLTYRDVSFWLGDIRGFPLGRERRDAVVSSMVLHHIEEKDKRAFYRKIFRALKPEGVFFNIDIFQGSSGYLQRVFMERWKEYMRSKGLPPDKVDEMIRRHRREDRPLRFLRELELLAGAGFEPVDVIRKQYNFAVYGGIKG